MAEFFEGLLSIILGIIFIAGLLYLYVRGRSAADQRKRDEVERERDLIVSARPRTIVRTYKGSTESKARERFEADAAKMVDLGYVPNQIAWTPGEWTTRDFVIAALLCILVIGIVIFLYFLIVKPDGTLTVTYERRDVAEEAEEKVCPQCAEKVKAAAQVCRYCGHKFGGP